MTYNHHGPSRLEDVIADHYGPDHDDVPVEVLTHNETGDEIIVLPCGCEYWVIPEMEFSGKVVDTL